MAEETLQNQVDEIRGLLKSQLRARGDSLEVQVRKAGRGLPRVIRQDAKVIVSAKSLLQNPKTARMVDQTAAQRAAQNVIAHLKTIDRRDRLKGRILGILGSVSAVFILTFIVVVYVLVKRGLI
jgi:hypothetical protein